jgi:hypothetical protein
MFRALLAATLIAFAAPARATPCTYSNIQWSESAPLMASPVGPSFGLIKEPWPRAEVALPDARRGTVDLTLAGSGLEVRAFVDGQKEGLLRPAGPIAFDDYLVARAYSYFRLVGSGQGHLTLELITGPELRAVAPPRTELPCASVAFQVAAKGDWPRPSDAHLPRSLRKVWLSPERDIEVRATPDGPVRATLRFEEENQAELFEERGDAVRVSTLVTTAMVYGWIPRASLLRKAHTGAIYGYGGLGIVGDGKSEAADPEQACASSLPLRARVGAAVFGIGSVAAGTPFKLLGADAETARVAFPHAWLLPSSEKVTLLLPPAAAACPVLRK